MPRLPQPGSDSGTWGDILNDYLSQVHKPDGNLKDNSVTNNVIAPNSVTNVELATDSVTAATIADGSITEQLLDSAVQTKLNASGGTPDWSTITNKPAVIAAGTDQAAARTAAGLGNVDNTSDATKNSATATLTNKTLLDPKIDEILTTAGKAVLGFQYVAGAGTNALNIANGYSGVDPFINVDGVDTNININLIPKGTGRVQQNGVTIPTVSSTDTLTNKTLTSPVINTSVSGSAVATAATASTLALRDSNANLSADAFVPSLTSTVTSGGTTTLTVDSNEVQIFTGTSVQTVLLPTTGVAAGQRYSVINSSSGGNLTVQSSGGNTVASLGAAVGAATFIALQATPTTAAHWTYMFAPATPASSSVSNSTLLQRTGQGHAQAANFIPSITSTTTAGGTTGLSNSANHVQLFTGTTTQTVTLPTAGINAGTSYSILNTSTGAVTVNASGGTTVSVVSGGQTLVVTANQTTPTTNAHWNIVGGTAGFVTPTSTDTLTNKTLTSPKINTVYDTTNNLPIAQFGVIDGSFSNMYLKFAARQAYSDNAPMIAPIGSPSNIGIDLYPKGTGPVGIYADSGKTPTLRAKGDDDDHNLNLMAKGAGTVQVGGVDVVTVSDDQTLTNKTLPVVGVEYLLNRYSGQVGLKVDATGGSDVNFVAVQSAPSGSAPLLTAVSNFGTDANLDLKLQTQGTGVVKANGVEVATVSGTQTLMNKTISGSANTITGITASSVTIANGNAPSVNSTSSLAGNTTATMDIPVPVGVVANDIVLVFVYHNGNSTNVVTPAAGFTQDTSSPLTTSGGNTTTVRVFWHRATASESGTYAFTLGSSTYCSAIAIRITGCVTTGNPINTSTGASTTTSVVNPPSVSMTTSAASALLIWTASDYSGYAMTPPSGFATAVDYGTQGTSNRLIAATAVQSAAGATGTKSGTGSSTTSYNTWMGALIPAATTALDVAISDLAAAAVSGSANGTPTALILWTGTQVQYDAIVTKDNNTVYVVT